LGWAQLGSGRINASVRKTEMTPDVKLLIAQFDAALGKLPSSQHLLVQRQVTDLFLSCSAFYNERQAAILNGLMGRLIERVDRRALLDLSGRLAAVDNAPANVIGRLSSDNDIAIAGPVLEKSKVLTDENLAAIAKVKSQDHLLAIAGRKRIGEIVTDVLVERGNGDVVRKVAGNPGASFSELGFVKIVHIASGNEVLAIALACRNDVPEELQPFLELAKA
jgi:uncharacterized protein (DUF2336 family)